MRPILRNHWWAGWMKSLTERLVRTQVVPGLASNERKIALGLLTCQCPCQWIGLVLDNRIPKRISYGNDMYIRQVIPTVIQQIPKIQKHPQKTYRCDRCLLCVYLDRHWRRTACYTWMLFSLSWLCDGLASGGLTSCLTWSSLVDVDASYLL
jgi:hypothetical protein